MDDSEIVELFWRRDQRAVDETAARYGAYCRAVAGRVLSSPQDAEECVNDALYRAWAAIPPQRPGSLPAFLGRLTRNLALDRLRHLSAQKRGGGEVALALSELEECVPAPGGVEEAVEGRLLAQRLERFVRALPSVQRRVFLQRYWYLCPVKEVAARNGMSVSKAASMLHRLRKSLKKYLEEEGIVVYEQTE